jgi:hypothetical protein
MLRQGGVVLLVSGLGYRPGQLIRDGQPWCSGGCRRRRGAGRDGQGACRGDDDGLGSVQPDFPVS